MLGSHKNNIRYSNGIGKQTKRHLQSCFRKTGFQNAEFSGLIQHRAVGVAANALEAKTDFSVKTDEEATVLMRWFPDVFYFHSRRSPAGQMGMFPQGSNYQGMTVLPVMTPEQFILNIVIPYAHPTTVNFLVTSQRNLTNRLYR